MYNIYKCVMYLRRADDAMDALTFTVASKLEEGNYTGAVWLACGSDSIAEPFPCYYTKPEEEASQPIP